MRLAVIGPATALSAAALAIALLAAAPHRAPAPRAQSAPLDAMIVSTAWLAQHLDDRNIVVIEVTDPDGQLAGPAVAGGHIPHARMLPYNRIIVTRNGLDWELPPADSLRSTFESVGISDSSRVVVYAPQLPMATRVLMTLDYLGQRHVAYLNGGLAQWRAEGRPLSSDTTPVARGHITPHPRPGAIITAEELMASAARPSQGRLALIDTRSDVEYLGTGSHRGMPSKGHLAGARQLQWEQLTDRGSSNLLRDRAQLAALYTDRVPPGDTVVTYCWVGYRASATYFVARALGYPVRLYDGSYQDWLHRGLPVHAGNAP